MRRRLLDFVDAEIVESLVYHLRERRVTLAAGRRSFVDRGLPRERLEPRAHYPGQRQTDRHRQSAVEHRTYRRDRRPESRGRRPRERRAGPPENQQGLPDRRRSHLRGRRHRRLPQPRVHFEGAGQNRDLPRVQRCRRTTRPNCFPTASTRFPKSRSSAPPKRASPTRACPTKSARPPTAKPPAATSSATAVACLKLLFHRETRELLGVHIIGDGAVELVHIGQAVIVAQRYDRLFREYRFQLSDAGRVLQECSAGRHQSPKCLKRSRLRDRDLDACRGPSVLVGRVECVGRGRFWVNCS